MRPARATLGDVELRRQPAALAVADRLPVPENVKGAVDALETQHHRSRLRARRVEVYLPAVTTGGVLGRALSGGRPGRGRPRWCTAASRTPASCQCDGTGISSQPVVGKSAAAKTRRVRPRAGRQMETPAAGQASGKRGTGRGRTTAPTPHRRKGTKAARGESRSRSRTPMVLPVFSQPAVLDKRGAFWAAARWPRPWEAASPCPRGHAPRAGQTPRERSPRAALRRSG